MCCWRLIVTADVLLKKSDVRGALGWIGPVWLAPILGSLLYYMFGINRVTRRALKLGGLDEAQASHPGADTDPDAAAQYRRLVRRRRQGHRRTPLTGGNALTLLQGGDEAYPAMLAAIARRAAIASPWRPTSSAMTRRDGNSPTP